MKHLFLLSLLVLSTAVLTEAENDRAYRHLEFPNSELAIVLCNPVYTDVGYKVDFPHSSNNMDSIYESLIINKLPIHLKKYSTCKSVHFASISDGQTLHIREMDDDDWKGIQFPVYNNKQVLTFDNCQPDFVLFIYNAAILSFSSDESGFIGDDDNKVEILFSGTYTIWDVKKGHLVSFGTFQNSKRFDNDEKTQDKIAYIGERVCDNIMDDSPFEK